MFMSNDALLKLPKNKNDGDFQMINAINKFLKDENGATAIEYGLIAALVAVAIVGALTTLGSGLTSMFGTVNSDL
jgi:pilus assembly protein Flp/PilA